MSHDRGRAVSERPAPAGAAVPQRKEGGREPPLCNVDDEDRCGSLPPEHAERVRGAEIAAAVLPQVDAP